MQRRDRRDQRFQRFLIILLGLFILNTVVMGLHRSLIFTGYFADGAFQMFNPLRRISVELPFEFFHGKGLPFLHYPIFVLLGKSIYASEFARHAISLVAYLISIFLVGRVLFRDRIQRLLFMAFLIAYGLVDSLNGLMVPGNSLLGLRTTTPLLLFVALATIAQARLRLIVISVLIAVTLVLGAEQGLYFILAYAGSQLLLLLIRRRNVRTRLILTIVPILFGAGLAVLLLALMGGGLQGALASLRYAYRDVPADQFWYFGTPPNTFIYQIGTFLEPWSSVPTLLWAALMFFVFRLVLHRPPKGWTQPNTASDQSGQDATTRLNEALFVLLSYGIFSTLSNLGYYYINYNMSPLWRINFIVGLWIILGEASAKMTAIRLITRRRSVQFVFLVVPTILIFSDSLPVYEDWARRLTGPRDDRPGILSKTWNSYLDGAIAAIDQDNATGANPARPVQLWSTYTSLLSDHYQVFNAAEDYVIHALGPERRAAYLETFRAAKPIYVETMRKVYFVFEEWLQNTTWDFYEDLLHNYRILYAGDHAFIWKRLDAPWINAESSCRSYPVQSGQTDFLLPINDFADAFRQSAGFSTDGFATTERDLGAVLVQVDYQVTNPFRSIPLFGGLPRFLIEPEKYQPVTRLPISLPPYQTKLRFPVIYRRGDQPRFAFRIKSLLPGATMTIKDICIRPLTVSAANRPFIDLDIHSSNPQFWR